MYRNQSTEIKCLNEALQKENAYLKQLLAENKIAFQPFSNISKVESPPENSGKIPESPSFPLNPEEKIALYRSLFRGRSDVYPIRWENTKTGKAGYSPTCHNEWDRKFCQKPRIKCSECPNQKWKTLTDQVIYDHLSGVHMIGIYPMLQSDQCFFLAIDFDKEQWQKDIAAFYNTCKRYDVPILIERSQSGRGGHAWIFFDDPVPASLARNLGTGLITLTMQEHPHLSMESYDRLFPNQDTLPKGGFGNLIALPLQGQRRKNGNSAFVDVENNFTTYSDPWLLLSQVQKLTLNQVNQFLKKIQEHTELLDVKLTLIEEDQLQPWNIPISNQEKYPTIEQPLPAEITITKANLLYVPLAELPSKLINKIRKIATFQNPEFYKAQAMRLSTFDKPRVINCSEYFQNYLGLPRGCEVEVLKLLEHYKISPQFNDQRESGKRMKIAFQGKLTKAQQKAESALLDHEIGVLSAATGFGKTVIAASIIGKRKVNTLILVHRQQLLTQWQERLSHFLSITGKPGIMGAGKFKPTFRIDVAMMQSLVKEGNVKDEVAQYGQIIVDECHHVSAFSFEQILKKSRAKYVLGLTATPFRKDGHQPIIFMQCGPIQYQVSTKAAALDHCHQCFVRIQSTAFNPPALSFSDLQRLLIEDRLRNELILKDLMSAYHEGRYPLLLTGRVNHIDWFDACLRAEGIKDIFIFKGGGSKKAKATMIKQLSESEGI